MIPNRLRNAVGAVALVAAFIGTGIGICIGIWFKLPDRTVDVFAFVESALGIILTTIALIVTLGVNKQRSEIDAMLVTKREEFHKVLSTKIEKNELTEYKRIMDEKYLHLEKEIWSLKKDRDRLSRMLGVPMSQLGQPPITSHGLKSIRPLHESDDKCS